MNKLMFSSIAFTLLLFSGACGVNNAIILNHNQNSTQVHLSSMNYRFVDKVSGSADVEYVLIFGGMNKKQLYENAYSKMLDAANLTGSKAIVNAVTEEHLGGVPPFYYKRTITVSAYVIEFTR